jgi:hypothetical protein
MNSISPNITRKISVDETPIITATEAGEWLNLSAGLITKHTAMLERLIKTVTENIENYTWTYIRRTVFEADFDLGANNFFSFWSGDLKLSLERSPIIALADISKIEYLNDSGVYVEFDRGTLLSEGIYENVTEKKERRGWASIYFDEEVPFDDTKINAYKIRITFEAGYTISDDITTDIPESLKTAMLMIVAAYYTNRGDCSDMGCDIGGFPIPCAAKSLIEQFAVSKTVLGGAYTPYTGCGSGFGC